MDNEFELDLDFGEDVPKKKKKKEKVPKKKKKSKEPKKSKEVYEDAPPRRTTGLVEPIIDCQVLMLRDLTTMMYPDELREQYNSHEEYEEDEVTYQDVITSMSDLDEDFANMQDTSGDFDTEDFLRSMEELTLDQGLPVFEEEETLFDLEELPELAELPELEDLPVFESTPIPKMKMKKQGKVESDPQSFGTSSATRASSTQITYNKDYLEKISKGVRG